MRMTPRHLLALGLVAALAFAACGGGGDDEEKAGGDDPTTTAEETTTTAEETTESAPNTMAGGSGDEETTTTAADGGEEGELLPFSFTDDFSEDTGWLIGCDEDAGSCALVQDGRLAEALDAGSRGFDQHEQFGGQIITNLEIEVTILDFGAGNPEAGAVCHYDPDAGTYYDFTIRADGSWSMYKFGADGEATALARGDDAPLFTQSYEKVVGTCEVNPDESVHLTMSINGEQVADETDSTNPLLPGQIGLVTYGDEEVDSSISFDDLRMEGSIYVE